jgi:putative transposase
VSNDGSLPIRRSIRLAHYDYSQGGAHFVTICTENKKCVFGVIRDEQMVCNKLGSLARQCWLETPEHFPRVILDEFIIMPNHMHGIIFLTDTLSPRVGAQHAAPAADKVREFRIMPQSLGAIVRSYKSAVTRQAHEVGLLAPGSLWQRNYYDHVIRNEQDLQEKRRYIANNPLKWALDDYHVAR